MKAKEKGKVVLAPSAKPLYSARSQRSIVEQWRLEEEISRLRLQIGYAEQRLEKAEKNRLRQLGLVSGGQYIYQHNLDESLSEIDSANRNIASFRQQLMFIKSKIAALQLSPADKAERERVQGLLADAARERYELDKLADAKLRGLLSILKTRSALSDQMLKLAGQIDLSRKMNLDVDRFESLRRSLPADLAAASSDWMIWFLGTEPDRKDYIIRREAVTLAETLRHAHAYRRGEVANLSEREAPEALKDEPLTREQEGALALLRYGPAPPQPPRLDARELRGYGIHRP